MQFTNNARDHVSLDEQDHVAWYDIQNTVNFRASLGLLDKGGEFVSNSPHDQGVVINEEMIVWPVGFKEV